MGLVNNEREGCDGGEGEGRRRDGTDKTARKVREGRLSAAKMMLRTRNVEMNCSREKGGGERGALSASSGDEEGARTRTTKNWIPSSCSALWMWSSIVRGRSSAFSAVEPRTNSSKIICGKREPTIQELARIHGCTATYWTCPHRDQDWGGLGQDTHPCRRAPRNGRCTITVSLWDRRRLWFVCTDAVG